MDVIFKKKRLAHLINDPDTDENLRNKLINAQEILEFAHQTLYLPDNGSYQHYTNLNRRYVVWNVVAAPEFSLTPKQWCYPIVGCMNYRGYFKEDNAIAYANTLSKDGLETYIGGVTAYSTLGWFKDPLINTMLDREDWEIARLIFHELAHQLVYIKNDTEFNEAFADSVSIIGLQHWLASQDPSKQSRVMELIEHESEFTQLILETRNTLQIIYESGNTADEIRNQKKQYFKLIKTTLARFQSGWSNDDRYQSWINNDINNARLSLISTYRELVPDFIALYQGSGTDIQNFYNQVKILSKCTKEIRMEYLAGMTGEQIPCGN